MNRLLLSWLILAAGTYSRAGVILSISPASQSVALGSLAGFDVDISGLSNGTALGTYDVNVGFDPTVLALSDIAFGNQLDISGLGDIQNTSLSLGRVEVFELSLDASSLLNTLQPPAFTVFTITFKAVSPSTISPVTLTTIALGDASGNPMSATIEGATLSVTSTPEPRCLMLLVVSSCLLLIRRKAFHKWLLCRSS